MDLIKNYFLTHLPGEFLEVQWTKGYKHVEILYHDRIVLIHHGAATLKDGVSYVTEELGEITLKLSERPFNLDIIVNNFHCINNKSHPKKQLKFASTYFWMLLFFALIAAFVEGAQYAEFPVIGTVLNTMNVITILLYVVAAIFTAKSKPWAFYLGFSVFAFWTFIATFTVFLGSFIDVFIYAIRLAFLYFLITNIKHAVGVRRHIQFDKPLKKNPELLDESV